MLSGFAGSQRKPWICQATGSSSKKHGSGCNHWPHRTVAGSQTLTAGNKGTNQVPAALIRNTWRTAKDLRIHSLTALQHNLFKFQYIKQCTALGVFGRYHPDTCHLNSQETSFSPIQIYILINITELTLFSHPLMMTFSALWLSQINKFLIISSN